MHGTMNLKLTDILCTLCLHFTLPCLMTIVQSKHAKFWHSTFPKHFQHTNLLLMQKSRDMCTLRLWRISTSVWKRRTSQRIHSLLIVHESLDLPDLNWTLEYTDLEPTLQCSLLTSRFLSHQCYRFLFDWKILTITKTMLFWTMEWLMKYQK
jgi:hypothetical protein